jgi:hypothetical protein
VRGLLLLVFAIGCGGKPHVTLRAPAPDLTPGQRVQTFHQLRTEATGVEWTTTCNRGCTTTSASLIRLSTGDVVRYAEDLVPVLPADSPAAAAARDVGTARRKAKRMGRIGLLMFAGGFITSMVGFSKENDPVMYLGLAGALGGFGLFIAGSVMYNGEIKDKTKLVFDSYDQNLAARLNVCVNGLAIVPCEQSVPGAVPAHAEPDPALRELRQK